MISFSDRVTSFVDIIATSSNGLGLSEIWFGEYGDSTTYSFKMVDDQNKIEDNGLYDCNWKTNSSYDILNVYFYV